MQEAAARSDGAANNAQDDFVNLPVTDIARSTAFYEALGGTLNPQFSSEHVSSMVFSDTITVMLLSYDHLRQFSSKQIVDATRSIDVLTTFSEDSRDAVDATVARGVQPEGVSTAPPTRTWVSSTAAGSRILTVIPSI